MEVEEVAVEQVWEKVREKEVKMLVLLVLQMMMLSHPSVRQLVAVQVLREEEEGNGGELCRQQQQLLLLEVEALIVRLLLEEILPLEVALTVADISFYACCLPSRSCQLRERLRDYGQLKEGGGEEQEVESQKAFGDWL